MSEKTLHTPQEAYGTLMTPDIQSLIFPMDPYEHGFLPPVAKAAWQFVDIDLWTNLGWPKMQKS